MVNEFEKIKNKILISIDEHIGKNFINNNSLQLSFFKEVGVKPSRSLSKTTYSGIAGTLSAFQSQTNYFSDEEIYDTFDSVNEFEILKEYLDALFKLEIDNKKLLNLYLDIQKILSDSSYEYLNTNFEKKESIEEETIKEEIERKERREKREKNKINIDSYSINNFKGFKTDIELPLNGKSMLIFGENGFGKTSIYEAINILHEKKDDERKVKESVIALKNDKNNSCLLKVKYTNSFYVNVSDTSIVLSKDFPTNFSFYLLPLNYKDILLLHFVDDGISNTQLYSKLIGLLSDFKVLGNETIINQFNKIQDIEKEKSVLSKKSYEFNDDVLQRLNSNKYSDDEINKLSSKFKKFEKEIKELDNKLNEIREVFEKDLNQLISTNLEDINIYFNKFCKNENIIINSIMFNTISHKINLELLYNKEKIKTNRIPKVLNEAKISALALSIYLTIIKNDIITENKMLLLDDLLISLDYQHRLPLIDILLDDFNEFQILLLTHDKKWFEIIKRRIINKKLDINWNFKELKKINEVVTLVDSKSFLDKAEYYLSEGEKRIAGIFCRLEFEKLLETLYTKHKIPIIKQDCYTSNDYIDSYPIKEIENLSELEKINFENIKDCISKPEDKEKIRELLSPLQFIINKRKKDYSFQKISEELLYFKDIILNNSSHNNEEWYFKEDVEKVIEKLKDLNQKLN